MLFKQSIALLFFLVFIASTHLEAQSLIVGIPSIQTAELNHLELTSESQFNTWSQDKLKWNSFNFLCYGLTHDFELTASVININNVGLRNEVIGVGFKKVHDFSKKDSNDTHSWQPKIGIGGNAFLTVYKPSWGYWAYAMGSVRAPKIKTRFTAGGGYGTREILGTTSKLVRLNNTDVWQTKSDEQFFLMFGVEQPITKHFSFVADWFSGNHDLAAFIPALQYELPRNVIIVGYKLPNEKSKGDAIIFELLHRF